ncbi:hypothetical protein GCM10028796_46040 [Ramlibacter monticola]
MRRREPPRRDWPEPHSGGPSEIRAYAPETLLIPGLLPATDDVQVHTLVMRLPDGSGPLRRIGICNSTGAVYREVTLHGPVQLLYLWAGLNALGFQQRPADEDVLSKYWLLFARDGGERLPPGAKGGQTPIP